MMNRIKIFVKSRSLLENIVSGLVVTFLAAFSWDKFRFVCWEILNIKIKIGWIALFIIICFASKYLKSRRKSFLNYTEDEIGKKNYRWSYNSQHKIVNLTMLCPNCGLEMKVIKDTDIYENEYIVHYCNQCREKISFDRNDNRLIIEEINKRLKYGTK